MNNSSLYIPIIDENVTMVNVVFVSEKDLDHAGKQYTYKTDLDLDVGDIVIVETYKWMSIARVVETDIEVPIEDDTIQYRWIVDVADTDYHKVRLDNEQEIIRGMRKMRTKNMREQMLAAVGLSMQEARMLLGAHDSVIDDAVATDTEDTPQSSDKADGY